MAAACLQFLGPEASHGSHGSCGKMPRTQWLLPVNLRHGSELSTTELCWPSVDAQIPEGCQGPGPPVKT